MFGLGLGVERLGVLQVCRPNIELVVASVIKFPELPNVLS